MFSYYDLGQLYTNSVWNIADLLWTSKYNKSQIRCAGIIATLGNYFMALSN